MPSKLASSDFSKNVSKGQRHARAGGGAKGCFIRTSEDDGQEHGEDGEEDGGEDTLDDTHDGLG